MRRVLPVLLLLALLLQQLVLPLLPGRIEQQAQGARGLDRLERDVLQISGLKVVVWLEGINDYGAGTATAAIIAGHAAGIARLRARGVRVVKAKTAAEARRKAWEKFKRRPPKSCFTLMEDRIDE